MPGSRKELDKQENDPETNMYYAKTRSQQIVLAGNGGEHGTQAPKKGKIKKGSKKWQEWTNASKKYKVVENFPCSTTSLKPSGTVCKTAVKQTV